MRLAAREKSREEGYAAMEAQAKLLREGKPRTEGGCVKQHEGTYRAVFTCQMRAPIVMLKALAALKSDVPSWTSSPCVKYRSIRRTQRLDGQRWQRRPAVCSRKQSMRCESWSRRGTFLGRSSNNLLLPSYSHNS